jgi:glycosyltransferase involved in cell wall biosynthesis
VKVLLVVHQYFPQCHSGTEQYCRATAREATRRGDEVVVLSLDPWVWRDDPPYWLRDEPYEGLSTPRLRHWEGLSANPILLDYHNPIVAARFDEVLEEVRPDAVHFFHLRRLGVDLIDRAVDRGLRTVVHLMDFWFLCPRFTLLRPDGSLCNGPPESGKGCIDCEFPQLALPEDLGEAARSAASAMRHPPHRPGPLSQWMAVVRRKDELLARLARVDAVIAPSRFLAEMFVANGFDRERIRVEPYGLEPGRVRRRTDVVRPRSPLRIAFAGVLSPWKGLHVLVDAVLQVRGACTLTVHGRTDEPMFQDYIDGVRERARCDARIAFPGPFQHGELDQVMADMDLLVVPSLWYENTPFVVLEAFEAGVPVAVSALGGMTEVVEPDRNGFHFPAGDVAALAELLQGLVDDPAPLAALSPLPGATIATNYDLFASLYRGAR